MNYECMDEVCFGGDIWRFSVTTLAFTATGTISHAVYIKYLKLGFLKVPKAVTTTQVVVTAGVVSEVSRFGKDKDKEVLSLICCVRYNVVYLQSTIRNYEAVCDLCKEIIKIMQE